MNRGGVLAPGAGLLREADGGLGVRARWYPETLVRRLRALRPLRRKVQVLHGDGLALIGSHASEPGTVFFVDPPYTAGGRNAGARLYAHHALEHPVLFEALAQVRGAFLATYDDAPEVRALAGRHRFEFSRIAMRSTHHRLRHELLITPAKTCPDT